MAAKLLGDRLYGVRLDTPSSRRGNMRKIVEEVRWTLDIHGYKHVKIFVSGGIDEKEILELRDVVDGFGVGTAIAMPKSVDISMDIVEVYENGRWVPRTKRGKLPGARMVYECIDGTAIVTRFDEQPRCPDASTPRPLLEKLVENGKILYQEEDLSEVRKRVLSKILKP
jgi:nicotinate phosphoribosyltransferase